MIKVHIDQKVVQPIPDTCYICQKIILVLYTNFLDILQFHKKWSNI